MTFTDLFYGLTELRVLLIVGMIIRNKIKIFAKAYIPASVIGGVLGLILGPQVLGLITIPDMFAQLAGPLGVVMMTSAVFGVDIKVGRLKSYATYAFLLFGIWGAQCTLGLLIGELVRSGYDLPKGWGFLGVCSFYGAHQIIPGMSEAFKVVNEDLAGMMLSLGMTTSTIGMLLSFIVGAVLVNIGIRRKWAKYMETPEKLPEYMLGGVMPADKQKDLGKEVTTEISVNTIALQFSWLLLSFAIGYGIIRILLVQVAGIEVLNKLPDLACGMIGAMILWPVLKKFKMSGYVDKRANSQVANACLEFMIIGSIASIQLSTVKTYIVPILILSVVMFALTVFYCLVVIRRVCKDDWFEKAMAAYGQNTGSSASAFTLVKMLDPDMKSTTLEEFGIYCGTLAPFTNFFMTLFPTIIVATGSIMIPSVAGAAIFVPALLLFFMSFRK